jgi:ComF family protein
MSILNKLKPVSDLFFPNGCIVCGKATTNANICPQCMYELNHIEPPFCTKCGKPFTSNKGISHICYDCIKDKNKFIMSRAVFEYNGATVKLIHRFKFGDQVNLSSFFSDELIKLYNIHFAAQGINAILPVPLSIRRLKHRSYNQTQLLAKRLSEKLSLPIFTQVLEKAKETPPQSRLSAEKRHENVKDAYRVTNNLLLKGKKVLLIDDVITTGATVNACTKALMRAGIKQVYVMAIAMRV